MQPKDMGVSISSDLSLSEPSVEVTSSPTSTVCQLDRFPRNNSTVLTEPELVDSSSKAECVPDLMATLSSGASSLTSDVDGTDVLHNGLSPAFCSEHAVAGTSKEQFSQPSTCSEGTCYTSEMVSILPSRDLSATDEIWSSPSTVASSNSVVLRSLDIVNQDHFSLNNSNIRTSLDNRVSTMSDRHHVEVVKNCTLSTQFATDADLEADLLSSRLLREFREAIKSAVDSISADRSHPQDDDLQCCLVPCPDLASTQSFVTVERQRTSHDNSPASVTRLSSLDMGAKCSRSAFQQFRMSNIPTLNGVNRCRTSLVDDLTAVTHKSAVTQNVLRHRRSLPDASQLRSVSSRQTTLPSRTNVTTRSSLVIGESS